MNGSSFHVDRWYPAVVAGVRAFRTVGGELPLTADQIFAAWERLSTGGALVVVDHPTGWFGRLTRFGRRGWAARLARGLAGAEHRDRWVVLPGTGGSHVLLHPDAPAFVAGMRVLPAGRLRWRVARRVLEMLGRIGLGDRLGFDELVVLVKGAAARADVEWLDELSRPALSVSLGVPGPLRKATVLACDATGEAQAVVKLSLTAAARACVRREADALERLVEIAPEATLAPELLGRGETAAGVVWLAQEVLPGARAGDGATPAHASFLAALHWRTAAHVPFEELELFSAACARLETLRPAVDGDWWNALAGLRDALRARLAGRAVPCAMAHGDFTPWNIVSSDGHLRAFDWEFAMDRAPALFDLAHFHAQTGVLVRRDSAERILASFDALLEGPSGAGLLQNAHLELRDVPSLLGLYVLHVATVDEELHRIERPPFPQVDWLRKARLALAHALEVRLIEEARTGRRTPAA